jgi:outer membrane immunogenic protein
MPLKAPPMVSASSWTGSYYGFSGGWFGGGHTSITHGANDPNFPAFALGAPESNSFSVTGGIFGFTSGYNWQFNQFVLGYEGDTSWVMSNGSAPDIAPFNPAFSESVKIQNLSTWRGRLGWLAAPDWLIYGTGGAALADERLEATSGAGITVGQDHYVWGYAAGGGLEWRFAPSFSLKAEYLHVGLNSKSFFNPSQNVGFLSDNRVKTSDDIVRVGFNWHVDVWSTLFH